MDKRATTRPLPAVALALALAVVGSIAGCAAGSGGQPAAGEVAPAASTTAFKPSLVEPILSNGAQTAGWYRDGISPRYPTPVAVPADKRPYMTASELQSLQSAPELADFMNVVYMPALTDVALIAHAVRPLTNDKVDQVLLRAVEADGHALALAIDANPAAADEISVEIKGNHEAMNALAARAARGDLAAIDQFATRAAQAARNPVWPAAVLAARSLTQAQHHFRQNLSRSAETTWAFWMLRKPSFAEAIGYLETQLAATRTVSAATGAPLTSAAVELPGSRPLRMDGRRREACFVIEAQGWNRSERLRYDAACLPDSVAWRAESNKRPWHDQLCESPAAAALFEKLAQRAFLDAAVLEGILQREAILRTRLTRGPVRVTKAESKASGDIALTSSVICGFSFVPVVDDSPARRRTPQPIEPHLPAAVQAAYSGLVQVEFVSSRNRRFRLLRLLNASPAKVYEEIAPVGW